jgi:tetratricopeptide (TPR) repeat protein
LTLRDSFHQAIRRLRLAAGLVLAAVLVLPARGLAQQASNVSLEANEQIFAVLAALNAAGYDTGAGVDTGNNVRAQVRSRLAKENISVLPELRAFYEEHRIANDSGADLGQFISLALLLGPPPGLNLTVPASDLPPDARKLTALVPLLKKFYVEADLAAIWKDVQPGYEAQIARYSEPVRRSIELTDAYLRFASGAYLGRKYMIDLDLLGSPEQAQARVYGSDYFLVVTPSKQLKLAEIRHQYLHFLLDPLAAKFVPEIHEKEQLLGNARQAPGLGQDFKDDFPLLLTECLIRAVELRMDKPGKEKADKAVKELTESGLILTPFFYETLATYEQQEGSISEYYRDMLKGLDVEKEQKRLSQVIFTAAPKPAASVAQPAKTELERQLDQGDNAIFEGHYAVAKAAYQAVLEKLDPKNQRALFGMAVVASNTRRPDAAETYFRKVLESASDVRLVTWSHIYLGRIEDLKGNRKAALEQYRAASLTATRFPDAFRAVQSGLSMPFGAEAPR